MYVVASLLNPTATLRTQELWQWLEQNCGLAGIKLTPLPHFSWQAAGQYDLEGVEAALRDLAGRTKPFNARTSGLGIFTGDNPVLYAPLVKTRCLMELQEEIWQVTQAHAAHLNAYYQTESWMPHVTLAYRDVTRENMACAMQELAFREIKMDIRVDHLALIYELDGQIGIKFRYDFLGK